jgi:Fe-S-cluster containining protein
MFSYVQVTKEETASLSPVLDLELRDDSAIFYQPCPHSVEQRCQIYGQRPGTCRTFRCKTLNALRNNEIDSAEADRRVREMLRSRAQLLPLLEEGETLNQARQRRQDIAADPSRVATQGAFLLKLTAFDLLLDRYFRNPGKAMFSRNSPAGSGSVTSPTRNDA